MLFLTILFSIHFGWASGGANFSDVEMDATLRASKGQKTMILSWSPHMPLSIKAVDEAIQFAIQNTINLVVVLDPNCEFRLAQKIATKHNWPSTYLKSIKSDMLIEKGLRVHYPSYIFVKQGGFSGATTPGYKSKEQLERMIGLYLK